MLPWEHVAVGYLCVSVLHRLALGRPPDARVAVAVVAAALVPDLIDKPLAWEFDLLPGGRSLGHSLAFGLLATALAWLAAGRRVAAAYATSLLAHLLTDVYYPVVFGGEPVWSFLAWPLREAPPSETAGFAVRTGEIAAQLRTFLGTPAGRAYALFEALLLALAFALWLLDGAPGRSWAALRDGRPGEASGER